MIYAIAGLSFIVILQSIMHRIEERKQTEFFAKQTKEIFADWREMAKDWTTEREQLLDRIQAPSFDHLKQAEIRAIKAQKEEPPVKYELV